MTTHFTFPNGQGHVPSLLTFQDCEQQSKSWERSQESSLDVMFRGHLVAMLAFLWIYVADGSVGWHTASLVAATTAGKGNGLAWSLQVWTWDYLEDETQLPVSNYGKHMQSIIQDEDLAEEIHMHLQSLGKNYLHALDVVEYLDKPEVKVWLRLKKKHRVSRLLCTGCM